MKTCAMCLQEKPVGKFRLNHRGKPHSYCAPCHKIYDSNRYRAQKSKRDRQVRKNTRQAVAEIQAIKAKTPCADCRGVFHFAAMQFDHLPGSNKTGNISTLVGQGCRLRALAEMKKCEIVCANCHAVRTYNRRAH